MNRESNLPVNLAQDRAGQTVAFTGFAQRKQRRRTDLFRDWLSRHLRRKL